MWFKLMGVYLFFVREGSEVRAFVAFCLNFEYQIFGTHVL